MVGSEFKDNTLGADDHYSVVADSKHDQLRQRIHFEYRELVRNPGNNFMGLAVGALGSPVHALPKSQGNATQKNYGDFCSDETEDRNFCRQDQATDADHRGSCSCGTDVHRIYSRW